MTGDRPLLAAVAVALLLATSVHAALPAPSGNAELSHGARGELTDREPIRIHGDDDLTASNGVVAGSGQPRDPYVIAGWRIDGGGTDGIRIVGTTKHLVVRDVHVTNSTDAIELRNVKHVTVANATLEGSLQGATVRNAVDLTLRHVQATGNAGDGVHLERVRVVHLGSNVLSGNGDDGLSGRELRRVDLVENRLHGNGDTGLHLDDAASVNATRNRVVDNGHVGIQLHRVRGGLLYDNVLENPVNARDEHGDNAWNVSKRPGPNVLGGPYLGGNHWSDYGGNDIDGDGLGDTQVPYPVGRRGDHLPLLPWNGTGDGTTNGTGDGDDDGNTTPSNEPPTANFTYAPQEPEAGEQVNLTDGSSDPDGNVTAWSWDLGDGNTSTDQHPNHTYEEAGNYTVTLTVTDDDGATASLARNLTVAPTATPDGGSSCSFSYRFLHGDGTPVNLTGRNVSFTLTDQRTGFTLDTRNGTTRVELTAGGYVNGSFPPDTCRSGDVLEGEVRVNHTVRHTRDTVPDSGHVEVQELLVLPLNVQLELHPRGPLGWHLRPYEAVPAEVTLRWSDGTPVDGANVSLESLWTRDAGDLTIRRVTTGTTGANGTLHTVVPYDATVGDGTTGAYLPGRHQVGVESWLRTPDVLYRGEAHATLAVVVDA